MYAIRSYYGVANLVRRQFVDDGDPSGIEVVGGCPARQALEQAEPAAAAEQAGTLGARNERATLRPRRMTRPLQDERLSLDCRAGDERMHRADSRRPRAGVLNRWKDDG